MFAKFEKRCLPVAASACCREGVRAELSSARHEQSLAPLVRCVRYAVILLIALCVTDALALNPLRTLDQFHHQNFAPRAGASSEVLASAQTDDGYLWVGTTSGLYRFDGVTFEPVSLLDGQNIARLPVNYLLSDSSGGLWIAYGGGAGAAYYKNGHYTRFDPQQGWDSMVCAVVDFDGVVWAVVDGRLVRIENLQRQALDARWGLPNSAVRELIIDHAGTLWVSLVGREDLMYLPRGATRFIPIGEHIGSSLLAAAADGTIFASGPQGLRAIVPNKNGQPFRVVTVSRKSFGRVLVDHDGGLLASTPHGLVHIGDARRLLGPTGESELMADTLTQAAGKTQTVGLAYSMIEDREGNIWIGSSAGLDRFRNSRFTPLRGPDTSFTYGVVAGVGGSVWAANWNSGLMKIEDRSRITIVDEVGPQISILYVDPTGTLWVAAPGGLWHSTASGRFVRAPIAENLLQPWVTNITMDNAGDLWMSSGTLVRGSLASGQWQEVLGTDVPERRLAPRAMLADSAGRTLLSRGSDIVRVRNGRPEILAELSARVQVGTIQTFSQRDAHLWVGGLNGIALVIGDDVMNLKVATGIPFRQVSGILETREGDLWVRGVDDAWHVPREELSRALADRRSTLEVEHFDALDGLMSSGLRTKSTLAQAGDGTLWFGTPKGLAWIDPSLPAPLASTAPALHVKYVAVDGVMQPDKRVVTLPALSHRVEIGYTAIELGYPERIEFRYKLEGFDRDWQLAGSRRVAYYNDLPPGQYRFRFMSTDRNGRLREDSGTEDETSLEIRATPAWFQMVWFKLGEVLLIVLLMALLYRLRIRHVMARIQQHVKEQVAERERIAQARQDERDRIARDLHDTLIQSTQGLIYIFQGLAEQFATDPKTRAKLDHALERANDVAVEGRNMIEDLRLPLSFAPDLASAFNEVGSEIGEGHATRFVSAVRGVVRKIEPGVYDALCRIGREALINAYRHAGATLIEVVIEYRDDVLLVTIRDDGKGMPPAMRAATRIPGHWGIQGMRERAERADAEFEISDVATGGTEVRLAISAQSAYRSPSQPPPKPGLSGSRK